MVDEYEGEGAVAEAVLRFQGRDRLPAVAERADDHADPFAHTRVVDDAPRDVRVARVELDRVQMGVVRHHPDRAQRAVAAVGSELQQATRPNPADRRVEKLTLLVADVHHEALAVAELVDGADRVVEVAQGGVCCDVLAKRLLAAVPNLPLGRQMHHPHAHAEERLGEQFIGRR